MDTTEAPSAKECVRCHAVKPLEEFNPNEKGGYLGRDCYCTPCRREYQLEHREKNRARYWAYDSVRRARKTAEAEGLPFDLTVEDVLPLPEVCPVLGIPLLLGSGSSRDNSPSIDKMIPARGYTKENARVISMRANRFKNNASLEELTAVVLWLQRELEDYWNG